MSTTAQGARSHCLTRLLLTQPELLVLLMLIVGCLVGTYHHEGPPLLRCLLRCFLDSRARPGTRKKLLGPLIAASLCSTAGSRGHPTRHLRCQKTTHFRLVVIRHGFGQINWWVERRCSLLFKLLTLFLLMVRSITILSFDLSCLNLIFIILSGSRWYLFKFERLIFLILFELIYPTCLNIIILGCGYICLVLLCFFVLFIKFIIAEAW